MAPSALAALAGRRRFAGALLPLLIVLAGCDLSVGALTGRATDEWTRSYPLSEGGEVQIGNTNGTVEVQGVDGSTVEVRAERIARAATDQGARELLPRIGIKEDIQPDRVAIETERLKGITIGVSFEVRYHVRVPKSALVHARTTNGGITLGALAGRVVAQSTNGSVSGRELSGGVEARTTNGGVTIDLVSLGRDPVDLRTTNGTIQLALPDTAKANVSASCVNGKIDLSGVTLETMGEQSRRRVRGRLNGGGTPIDLGTTNGTIRVRARSVRVSPSATARRAQRWGGAASPVGGSAEGNGATGSASGVGLGLASGR